MRLVVFALIVTLLSCEKEKKKPPLPLGVSESVADRNRKAMASAETPPWFSHIPRDTPYLLTSFDGLQGDELVVFLNLLNDLSQHDCEILDQVGGNAVCPAGLMANVGCEHLEPTLLDELGVGGSARVAMYGVGLAPAVRFDIRSHDAVVKNVDAMMNRLSEDNPGLVERGEFEKGVYWINTQERAGWWGGIAAYQDHVAFVYVPWPQRDKGRAHLLGKDSGAGMSDAAELRAVADEYGFGPRFLGYVDTLKFAQALQDESWIGASSRWIWGDDYEQCTPALDQLAQTVQRVGIGIDTLNSAAIEHRVVVDFARPVATSRQKRARTPEYLQDQFDGQVSAVLGLGLSKEEIVDLLSNLQGPLGDHDCAGLVAASDFAAAKGMLAMVPEYDSVSLAVGDHALLAARVAAGDTDAVLGRLMASHLVKDGTFRPHEVAMAGLSMRIAATNKDVQISLDSTYDQTAAALSNVSRENTAALVLDWRASVLRELPGGTWPLSWLDDGIDSYRLRIDIGGDKVVLSGQLKPRQR